jgi:hypothetical protein
MSVVCTKTRGCYDLVVFEFIPVIRISWTLLRHRIPM